MFPKKKNILKNTSEKIKNASKTGGILPRPKNNNNNNTINKLFPGNNNNRIVIMFISGTGMKTPINVPIDVSVHDLFVAFIRKMNLDPSVLGKFIYFLYNGLRIPIDENSTVINYGLKNADVLVVIDTSNLLGGEINL